MTAIETLAPPLRAGPGELGRALLARRAERARKRGRTTKLLKSIAVSVREISETVRQGFSEEFDGPDTEKVVQRIAEACSERRNALLEDAIDEVQEFFAEYSPKRLHKRILVENALDSQYDKLSARLVIEQEAALRKEKMSPRQPIADNPSVEETHRNVDRTTISTVAAIEFADASEGLDLAELDRDDNDPFEEEDEWQHPQD